MTDVINNIREAKSTCRTKEDTKRVHKTQFYLYKILGNSDYCILTKKKKRSGTAREWEKDCQGDKENFESDECVCCLDGSGGFAGMFIYQNIKLCTRR